MLDIEFDCQQIEKALPKYKFIHRLGKGSYGKVYLVSDRETGQLLALKKINCFGMCEYERNNAMNEVRILASLDHQNIIKFKSSLLDSNEDDLYIFMEYASQGDLATMIEQSKDKKRKITQSLVWTVLLDAAQGLQYLHKNSIIHRDIKPANIFKSSSSKQHGVYKLGDMNVSKIISNGDFAKTQTGSPLYVCPQVWSGKQEGYNQKCDIWSLGVVAYELCSLKVPYEAASIQELIRKQKSVRLKNIPAGYSQNLNQAIHQMLQVNPKKRISAERLKFQCQKNLKIIGEESSVSVDPLIDTLVFPDQTQQRWVNLVPLPPKSCRKDTSTLEIRKESRNIIQKAQATNRVNVLTSVGNRSLLIPKGKPSNSQQKGGRIRLPSIQKKNSSQERENKSRQKSREKSRQKSKQKSQTPQKKEASSSKITRKLSIHEYIRPIREQVANC